MDKHKGDFQDGKFDIEKIGDHAFVPRGAGTLAQLIGEDQAEREISEQEISEAQLLHSAMEWYGSPGGRGNSYDRPIPVLEQ